VKRRQNPADPAAFAKTLIETMGYREAEAFALEAATREKTTFWVGVLLEVMKPARAPGVRQGRAAVISYGGGLDSFCMLVEGVRRGERIDAVAFVDVTDPEQLDPGEWPGTYRHIREVVEPFCKKHGIPFVWISSDCYPLRKGKEGEARSLYSWWKARKQIPVAQKKYRVCTLVAKVERFQAWLADAFPGQEVDVWIGFEKGEEGRAESDPNVGGMRELEHGTVRRNRFPLMEWGLCRCRCAAIVRDQGFPVPRKSACMACPLGSKGDWQTLAREQPHRFKQIHKLELDKPPTAERGRKLSIMGYRTHYHPDDMHLPREERRVLKITAPMLPEYIQGTFKSKGLACPECGVTPRMTKATGSGYVTSEEMAHIPAYAPKGRR
jgi:hypothetical protein